MRRWLHGGPMFMCYTEGSSTIAEERIIGIRSSAEDDGLAKACLESTISRDELADQADESFGSLRFNATELMQ